jgi:hypothetical protein
MSQGRDSSSSSACSTCASMETGVTSPSSSVHTCSSHDSSVSRSLSYPPQMSRNSLGSRPGTSEPPYAPFLSHAPPPADSWIEVETTPTEYRLNVKLPGFKRDGMYVYQNSI